MNKISFLLCLFFLAVNLPSVSAQDEKQEEKFWKKKAKEYVKNPLSLKAEIEAFQKQIGNLKQEVADLNARVEKAAEEALTRESEKQQVSAELARTKERLNTQTREIEEVRTRLKAKEEELAASGPATSTGGGGGTGNLRGIVYRLQIGAFLQDTTTVVEGGNSTIFEIEKDDEMSKYVLATFHSYEEAVALRDKLRRMGMKDTWIVPYKDGARTTMEELLQGQASKAAATGQADASQPEAAKSIKK